MRHECAQAGCDEAATHCVVESHPLAMLFESGAGLMCEKHARGYRDIGGLVIALGEPREVDGRIYVPVLEEA